jgi:hypothetical protein
MYDPCIPEAISGYEHMVRTHKRELLHSKLDWQIVTVGGTEQLVPVFILDFKF